MPSERRLHPASFLFVVAGQARELILPGLAVIFTAGTTGGDWQVWLMVLFVPYAAIAAVHAIVYRYRFEESEIVVRSGAIFRNERHIPYARVQNIDAVQNVFHRVLGVVEVRLETGAGGEPEAIMRVLPVAQFHELQARVLSGKAQQAGVPETAAPETTDKGRVVLALPRSELLLNGFIDNRSAIVFAAGFGLLWELGLMDRAMGAFLGESTAGRGMVVRFTRSLFGGSLPPIRGLLVALAALMLLLLVIRVISMAFSVVRLHGFTLTRVGDDLRAEFGLLTRVVATIPVRRIQMLTVTEGPLHRLFGRVSVRVDTAGGEGREGASVKREPLAPILPRDSLRQLLREVLPEISLESLSWQPPAPRALRREIVRGGIVAVLISGATVLVLDWWTPILLIALLAIVVVHARKTIAHLRWAETADEVLFRSGWLWRHISIARFSKIQVAVLTRSPFDRRTGMASVVVDTAGAGSASHRMAIPYLALETAQGLHGTLTAQAARRRFKW